MTDFKPLNIQASKSENDLSNIYNFNVEVFSEGADFHWTLDNIKQEVEQGWELFSASVGNEIIAAIFLKKEGKVLYTKHTPIKLEHRGRGYSHLIKDFIESKAKETGADKIINVCRIDNFRMISLNETHGYKKTGQVQGDQMLVEWVKDIPQKK